MNRDDLKPKEPHPATQSAINYVLQRINDPLLIEALASCAIESNRMAEICLGTINRIKNGELVSDRYVLGLAWFLKDIEEKDTLKLIDKLTKEIDNAKILDGDGYTSHHVVGERR